MGVGPLNDLFDVVLYQLFKTTPDQFSFTGMPLSQRTTCWAICASYLAIVLSGSFLMRYVEKPVTFKWIFFWHNAVLSTASAYLLGLFMENLIPIIYNHGLFFAICDAGAYTNRMELLYYINYLFKFWELADTVFLVLKKKQLEFLHVYHHAATAYLCFIELDGRTSVSWVVITLNLLVHVIMYYYYARTTVSSKPVWWKKHLTTMQITQFVIDLGVIYFATYNLYVSRYYKHLPHYGGCYGSEEAAQVGCVILSSYLLLFIQFFIKTYYGIRASRASKANGVNGSAPKSTRSKKAE
ncbi:very-long-chain 3-oxoacyl-CoA synthase [Synchytrium microbalum]|uniref:Elongation of fatty acids protein n=1 Tax=Synchytrium microbalum TaxID=1806994 RepID=A0A507BNE7_9FUNG|nr:very-long-chain 3-oxoacyl-CoA synthase [Synchytrium microbalum]TPX31017.1 very-long-chain 3-oxoacyl-CoA synthase [Synchytrium microbalum]